MLIYGISLLALSLAIHALLARDKRQRTTLNGSRQYSSFSRYQRNMILRLVAKSVGYTSMLTGLALLVLGLRNW